MNMKHEMFCYTSHNWALRNCH